MRVAGFASARRFLERAGGWLGAREAENNLILGLALSLAEREEAADAPRTPERATADTGWAPEEVTGEVGGARREEAPWFAVVESGDEILGAAFRTPPHLLGLTDLPERCLPLLKRAVAQRYDHLPGVVGPPRAARAMAALWAAGHAVQMRSGPRMEIMALTEPPRRPPASTGRLRLAAAEEAPLFNEWLAGFERDTGIFSEGADRTVAKLLEEGALFAWEVAGAPVAMVATSGATPRALRVSYVYTPPEHRGRGYASDSTAELSRRILESGREFCVLYVDVNDPVANHIYRSLGYETVAESQVLLFDDPATS